jgi:hypothetical protein
MALKGTIEKKAEASVVANPLANTTVLELSLYAKYTWGNVTYEKGKPYRFKNSDAMILMGELDHGRPIWRVYQPPVQRQAPRNEVVDATMISAPVPVDEFGQSVGPRMPPKRIEVGDDSEIADILNPPDDNENVTV